MDTHLCATTIRKNYALVGQKSLILFPSLPVMAFHVLYILSAHTSCTLSLLLSVEGSEVYRIYIKRLLVIWGGGMFDSSIFYREADFKKKMQSNNVDHLDSAGRGWLGLLGSIYFPWKYRLNLDRVVSIFHSQFRCIEFYAFYCMDCSGKTLLEFCQLWVGVRAHDAFCKSKGLPCCLCTFLLTALVQCPVCWLASGLWHRGWCTSLLLNV